MAQNEILLKLRGTSDFSDIQSDVKTLQNYFKSLKLPKGLTKNLESSLEGLDKELLTFQQHMNSGFKTKGDITGLEKSGQKIIQMFGKVQDAIEGIDNSKLKEIFQLDTSELDKARAEVASIKKELKEKLNLTPKIDKNGKAELSELQQKIKNLQDLSKTKKIVLLKDAIEQGDIDQIQRAVEGLRNYSDALDTMDKGKPTQNAVKFRAAFEELSKTIEGFKLDEFQGKIKKAEAQAEELEKEFESLGKTNLENLNTQVQRLTTNVTQTASETEKAAQAQYQFNNELSQIKDSVTQFFSLVNVAQLVRRAFQDVYNTVKELDAVMTETAVVTDFSIGDMWDKLPEYTAQAKALGVATKDLYAATTLYYQQGLDTNASMAAGVETMKMARIAGMEATQATDAMTAALRGFNMEVNEMNAQNVNDVYSKLAAITASDTEEIATAMSKTAAIANSVGAEFENIAVFLAQGIETTRESADAIGTAMKTILARFNEMKKDPSEIGEIDGEIVDANKVETALRSVGIALRDTNGEFRNADQVLLEVAQKWDSMSVMQQRYIATTAAGSRQQSRFIAFMQDYNRTMELQTAAYNAEGAAQQQYEKTLESLDAKVAKLKDTWDEFILGIANSDVIKGAVDALSDLLDIINKMTNAPGILGGVLKSLLAFGVFKGGKKGIALLDGLLAGKEAARRAANIGESASEAFKTGFSKGFKDKKNHQGKISEFIYGKGNNGLIELIKNKKQLSQGKLSFDTSKAIEEVEKWNENVNISQEMLDGYKKALVDNEEKILSISAAEGLLEEAEDGLADATQNLTQLQLANTTGIELNNEQQQAGLSLIEAGVRGDIAARAAKADLTKENILQALSEKGVKEATEEQIEQETLRQVLLKGTIVDKLKSVAISLQQAAAQKIENATDKESVRIKVLQKYAQLGVNAATATYIGLAAAATLAVAGLVVGVIALAKWAKTQTLEYKMEQAAEATKKAAWAANEAKTAYEDLLSSKEEYDGFQKTLEDLTYGTLEWKKALVDANQQVLELLKTYPALAKYIQRDNQGVLTISEEGWDQALNTQITSTEVAQSSLLLSQYQELLLNKPEMLITSTEGNPEATKKMLSSAAVTEYAGNLGFFKAILDIFTGEMDKKLDSASAETLQNQEIGNELSSDFQKGLNILDESYIKGLQQKYSSYSESQIKQYAEDIEKYYNDLENYNNQIDIIAQSIGNSVSEISNLEEGENLSWILGERFTKEYDSMLSEAKLDVPESYEEAVQQYATILGVSTETIKEQYEDSKDGLEKLRNDIARSKVSEKINKESKKFAKEWTKFGDEAQEAISALLSQDGKSLTQDQIDAFSFNADGTSKTVGQQKKYLESLGISNENVKLLFGYDTIQDMIKAIEGNITTATVAFEDSKENFANLMKGTESSWGGGIWENLMGQMTSGAAKDFNDILSSIMVDMGTEGVESYLNLVDSISKKLSDGGKKKLLEGLSLINLEDIENAEDLRAALDSIGISSIELTDKELKDLNEEIQALAATASRKIVDIAEAEKMIASGQSAKKILKEAIDDSKYEFSKEDYDTLLTAGASAGDFFYDGETYTYLSDTVDLLQKIQADTTAMRQKLLTQVKQDTIEGATIADWVAGDDIEIGGKKYTRESLISSALASEAIEGYSAAELMEEIFGENTEGWSDAYAKAMLESRYANYGLGGTAYSENLSLFEKHSNEQFGATAMGQSTAENINTIEKYQTTYDNLQKKVDKGIGLSEKETVAHKEAEAAIKQTTQALKKKAKQVGITEKEVEEYINTNNLSGLAEEVTTRQIETNLAKVKEETQDFFDVLTNGATGVEQNNAFNGIIQAADQYLGLEIDKEFLEDANNLEAFKTAINGTKEDFYSFISAISQNNTKEAVDLLGIKNETQEVADAFADAKAQISTDSQEMTNIIKALNDVEFKVDGTADFTQIYNAIYKVTQNAEIAQQILEGLAGTNVSFDVKYEWKEVDEATYDAFTAAGGAGSMYDTSLRSKNGKKHYTIKMPKFTGTLTGNNIVEDDNGTTDTGGGGTKNEEKYSSEADKFHNLQKDIDKTSEDRNKLEEEYAELLEDENASLSDISDKQQEIIKNLQEENRLSNQKVTGRKQQIQNEFDTNDVLSKYAYWDKTTGEIKYRLDDNGNPLINRETDSEIGEKFDEGWEKVTSWVEDVNTLEQNIEDNEKSISEYREAGIINLDKSFNTLEKIEKGAQRLKEIEAEISRILSAVFLDTKKLGEAYTDQIAQLQEQITLWEQIKEQRQQQYDNLKNSNVGKEYFDLGYVIEIEPGVFEVDWDKLGAENQDIQDAVVGFIEKLNTASDNLDEASDNVVDFGQQLSDVYQDLINGAIDSIDQIRNLVTEQYQKNIDALTNEHEAINESNQNLVDSIQKAIDDERQARENEKTEEDIADMENRLAYLRADTTGANALEIKNLEKELQEKKEDYTDTLIDQKISELQEQNDDAAAQREVQINLAQAQLDQAIANGTINQEVMNLINEGIDEDTYTIVPGSKLETLLTNSSEYVSSTFLEQEQWMNNILTNLTKLQILETGVPINFAYVAGSKIANEDFLTSIFTDAINNSELTQEQKDTLLGQMSETSLKGEAAYNSLKSAGLSDAQAKAIMKQWGSNSNTTYNADWINKKLDTWGATYDKTKINSALVNSLDSWKGSEEKIYELLNTWGVGDKLDGTMKVFSFMASALTGYKITANKDGGVDFTSPDGKTTTSVNGLALDPLTNSIKQKDGEKITSTTKSNYTPEVARAILMYSSKQFSAKQLNDVLKKHGLTWEASDLTGDGNRTAADARAALRLSEGLDQASDATMATLLSILSSKNESQIKKVFKNAGYQYATGGLADYTGPAWLDGTKSKPELVLNAQDTQNFIQLKDILSSVMKNAHSINANEKSGDVYYEIHIDVEKLTSDYDVDDVANRVKSIIAQDAMYRNNNVITRMR